MRNLALAGLLVMAAPAAPAQTVQQPAVDTQQIDAGGPANLCHELVAFMTGAPPGPAPGAAAAARPPAGQAAAPAPGAAPPGGAPVSSQAVPPAAPGASSSAQQITGQAGVAVDAPAPQGAPAAGMGSAHQAPQKSSRSAPVPTDDKSTPKESVMTVEEAEALAAANDMQACRDAAQKLRRAGVAMPPPLLALAALDLRFFNAPPR